MSTDTFNRLMSHSITLVRQKRDYTGSLTDDVAYTDEKAFVQYGAKRMVNTEGEEITATAIVFLPADSNFDPGHFLWRIEHGNRKMKLAAPEVIDDPRTGATHHYELGVI